MEKKLRQIKKIAWISGVFTVFVGILLILNYVQYASADPVESKTLGLLVERLAAEPDNAALTEEIRQLDLLARKAYFNSIWQIRTGGLLLILGAVVFVLSLRIWFKWRFRIDMPSEQVLNDRQSRMKSQRWIAFSGLFFLLLSGSAAVLSSLKLDSADAGGPALTEVASGVEVVDIERADSSVTALDSTALDTSEIETMIPLDETTIKQQHNSFRGAWGNGVSTRKGIPTSWNVASKKALLWKTKIPVSGKNSPVVWGNRIFLTGATASKRMVYCFDRLTGALLWEKPANNIPGSPAAAPATTDDTGLAAPSVAVDGNSVFALFGNGDIIALNLKGDRIWAKNLGVPDNHYGHSSSLLVWAGKVFVQYDTHSGCKVLALNTETGKTVWSTPRSNDVSWSSPILAKINGKIQLVLQANPNVAGYDINSGKQLWSVDCMSGEVGPSPAYGGGLVYAANEYAKLVGIDPKSASVVWESNEKLPEVSSPVYIDGLLFVATTYSVLACFDAKTGHLLWEYEAKAGFYSSPMIADGKLYLFDTNGKGYVFAPGRTMKLLASSDMGEGVFATPAFADGCMYVRGSKHLFAIGKAQ